MSSHALRSSTVLSRGLDGAVVLALAVLTIAAVGLTVAAIPALYVATVTPALVRIDLRDRRLPNRLVLPGLAVAVVAAVLVGGETAGRLGLASGLAYGTFLLLLSLAGGMGMGDVKLGATLGVVAGIAGPTTALLSPALAFTAGGIAAAVTLMARPRSLGLSSAPAKASALARRTSLAFGPYLLAGFWLAFGLGGLRPVL